MSMHARHPRRRPHWAVPFALAVVALLVGLWLGGHPTWLPAPVRSAFVSQSSEEQLINNVYGLLQHDYYRPVTRATLVNKGLAAAVASLGDPYSHYFSPSDYHAFQSQSDPHLSGIGISPAMDAAGLRVVEVFPGSPAARAGLVRGDVIVSVGSTSLANRSEASSAGLIRGRAGTRVTLTIRSRHRRRVVTLTRADIAVPVASGNVRAYHGHELGIVQLTSFTAGSGDELRAQVDKVLHAGAKALVLDLRANGGGLLDEGVNVASIFIPDGTIVSTAGRSQPRQVYMAKGGAIPIRIPLVVLVDHGTASSAEIVTGALQDRHRATVVGTPTYGKGVFQEINPLPNGGALDFTVGEYFTPSGRNLGGGGIARGAGISPDITASTDPRGKIDTALIVAERTAAGKLP